MMKIEPQGIRNLSSAKLSGATKEGVSDDTPHLYANIQSKGFGTADRYRPVIQNLNFEVRRGEIVTLLGPSGCGKSTTLRIIAGLDTEFEGAVYLCGQPIYRPGKNRGIVFQESRLLGWRRVDDNVAFALPANLAAGERHIRVEEMLKRVGLWHARKLWPYQLSGGMEKRAALARALVNTPDVLLLDEPFSALDVLTKYALQKLVADMCVRERLTTVLVTHDIDEALYFSDRIAVLSNSPATIQVEFTIDLPRPRCRTSEAFESHRFKLLNYYLKKFGEPEMSQ